MNEKLVIEEEIKDGVTFKVLDLTRTITRPLDNLRDYLKQDMDKISLDGRLKTRESLLDMIQTGMEERDKIIVRDSLQQWTRDNLLDLLYELEYQRFLDLKLHTVDIFHKIILPHLQNKELQDGYFYTVAYGDSASVVDAKTLSLLYTCYSTNGIDDNRISLENSDIAYFNSDTTRDGKSKTISNKQPIEVSKDCIQKVIKELTGDDGTELNRDRKRRLKYHRAKLELKDFVIGGNKFNPTLDSSAFAIKSIAMELYSSRMRADSDRYYISIKDLNLSKIINSALWEIFYTANTRGRAVIEKAMTTLFPVNKIVLYSLGEAIDATYLIKATGGKLTEEQAKKALTAHSVCVAKVDKHDVKNQILTLSLRLVIGIGWEIKPNIKVSYSQIFTSYEKGSMMKVSRTDELFLNQVVYNTQRILIPAEHAWDLVHPSGPMLNLGKEFASEGLMIHWCDLEEEEK